MYINKLDDIANEYNNAYHTTIKMKPTNVKPSRYTDIGVEDNDKYPKFKVGDHVRISKYRNIFAKYYTPNWSEGVFVTKKVKNTASWSYLIGDLYSEEIVEMFCGKKTAKDTSKQLKR